MNFDDPPSPSAVVRTALGAATALSAIAFVVVSLGSGGIEWKLGALVLALWGAYGFFGSFLGGVVEPLGRFFGAQRAGGALPPEESRITIDQETAALERVLAAEPPLPAHRTILAGIRLAEIYRTHQHDEGKAGALRARLAAAYPGAPELEYVRPPTAG